MTGPTLAADLHKDRTMVVKSPNRGAALSDHRRRTRDRAVNPDELFDRLQDRDLTVDGRTWRIEVYSIRDRGRVRWIQLALDGIPRHILALKLATGDGHRPAVLALSSWLAKPCEAKHILRVASARSLHLTARPHNGSGLDPVNTH